MLKDLKRIYLPKGIIKNHNVIIIGKSFHDQPIDSDIKRYKEKRKLTARKPEDYTKRSLLVYNSKIIINSKIQKSYNL